MKKLIAYFFLLACSGEVDAQSIKHDLKCEELDEQRACVCPPTQTIELEFDRPSSTYEPAIVSKKYFDIVFTFPSNAHDGYENFSEIEVVDSKAKRVFKNKPPKQLWTVGCGAYLDAIGAESPTSISGKLLIPTFDLVGMQKLKQITDRGEGLFVLVPRSPVDVCAYLQSCAVSASDRAEAIGSITRQMDAYTQSSLEASE